MHRVLLFVLITILTAACSDKEVGDVSLGVFTTKDIKIDALQDPIVSGVTCHISSIEANLDLSDPSDSSIACRQTGEITVQMLSQIDQSDAGEVVFKKSKSIFFKNMKVRRIYDKTNHTLIYVSYSTKEISGSYKHSLSTVPLWETIAQDK
ncbi:CreA family protein [Agaribacter marinus]|uniref:Catabolite regulation protein CreA n=1 Tax=Agaribacter marinus TaxID=1431249 RepID=A0AA37SXD5_9ALTE|nr:CreA family protein [Agaribacter marinus]GLR71593.1 catabolite regulation protein CreA [Agaribacter marinus]